MAYKKSISHERRVTGYLNPCTYAKLESYVNRTDCTKSEVVAEALRVYIDREETGKNNPIKDFNTFK